ncbi:hypothetical protein [Novosphingobium sp.]|uniref:hypothetical protein n=1 Tax=Novosphingobium sp. TaxID=1874826 RepID=UPI0038B8F0C0
MILADGSIVEGTPEEFAQYEAFRKLHGANEPSQLKAVGSTTASEGDWQYVSSDVAFRALTRIKLGREAKAVLSYIYTEGDAWTPATVLQQKIGYSPSQFAGLMGAFGRRLVNTGGYVLNSAFFEQEWDSERLCYLYRLPPSVRAAVEKARIPDYDL